MINILVTEMVGQLDLLTFMIDTAGELGNKHFDNEHGERFFAFVRF